MQRIVIALLGTMIGLLAAGCAGPQAQPLMPTPLLFSELDLSPLDHIPPEQRWKPRRVFYATTRQRDTDLQRIDYGNRESNEISIGMALVGFGDDNVSWSDLSEYSRQSDRAEVVDLSIAGLVEAGQVRLDHDGSLSDDAGAAAWLIADVNAAIEAARDRDLLVYVHGAKVNFYNANAFAAQLDHFMGRDMTSMAFSWPTRQNILAYGSGSDVRRAYRAAPALSALLEGLAKKTVARRIHIICWSAGGRVVTSALQQLHERHASTTENLRERLRIGTVYYAAADVPGQEFLDALPALDALANRVVVTVSSDDGALDMARLFMGGGVRIGQRDTAIDDEQLERVKAADRLEVVDVSRDWEGRGFDITGHRYWFDHPWASTDMILAVRSDLDPSERGLSQTDLDLLWGIPPDYPARLRGNLSRENLELRRSQ